MRNRGADMNNQKENPGHGVAGESSVLLTQSHTTNSSTSLDDLLTASVDNYLRHGWKLCVVPPGSKGPATTGWNKPENAVTRAEQVPTHHGVGLLHAQSGSMALDIDDWGNAVTKLQEHGIDLNQLYQAPDAVIIDSGNPGHGKLLYRMPHGVILPTKKITEGRTTLYELRCATTNGLSVQDVLPPTIHPGTNQPYR
ncbi:MAG: bifunctional DNA primase/polymerase [Sedimenticola sp.]